MLEKITDAIDKIVIRSKISGTAGENCYLVKGENGATVIDTGDYSEAGMQMWEEVFAQGVKIEKIVLTHTHKDHIGLAKWLQETKNIPIIVAKLGYPEMKNYLDPGFNQKFNRLIQQYGYTKGLVSYQKDPFIYDFEPDGYFEPEGTIQLGDDTYEIIWTPGHADDHFCFYQREKKVMFCGDHIINNMSPVVGIWNGEESNVLQDYFESLDRIKRYPTEIALAGHGETFYNLHEQADIIKEKHLHRLGQLLELTDGNWKTAEQVTHAIYGPVKAVGPFMAALTRMLYLEAKGKLKRKTQDGVVFFQAVSS